MTIIIVTPSWVWEMVYLTSNVENNQLAQKKDFLKCVFSWIGILEFFPLLLAWSYFIFIFFCFWSHNIWSYLEIWASDSLFHCLHLCHTMEEGADFCSILHSNSVSPEGPLSASFCFMELRTLTLSWIVSWLSIELALFTPEGQEPCFVPHSPSIQLWGWQVAGVCHSTNTWLIKWITKGAGCSPWVSASIISAGSVCGICIIEIWSFTCAKASPNIVYSPN